MKNECCLNCESRKPACWGTCETYKAWKAKIDAGKDAKQKAYLIDSYRVKRVEKSRNRNKKQYSNKKGTEL